MALVLGKSPYIKPPNPEKLFLCTETRYQIAQRHNEHAKVLRMFQEYLLVTLHTPITNKIIQSIPTIFDYLFKTYGDVTPQELQYLTAQVESMNFPLNGHLNTVFTF